GLCGAQSQPAEIFPASPALRRLTLECRGHGASPPGPLDCLSIRTFADDAAAFLQASTSRPAVVGGISMGAAIALRLAITRPDLVRALVLARPAWTTRHAPANMAPNALAGRLLARHPPEVARHLFLQSPLATRLRRHAPDNLASLLGFFARPPQAVTAALLQRISADGPGIAEADLARLQVPTLALGHGLDLIHPLRHVRTLARAIPGVRLAEITPKAVSPERYRADFRAALASFLIGLS
uniref:alpha/beta fold hydrolase n=1 Tax=Geminicoccus flavidas TaxID=2506407 RepID=UPI0013585632